MPGNSSFKRQYPDFYERIVPVVLGLLVVLILGLVVFSLAVAFGLLQWG